MSQQITSVIFPTQSEWHVRIFYFKPHFITSFPQNIPGGYRDMLRLIFCRGRSWRRFCWLDCVVRRACERPWFVTFRWITLFVIMLGTRDRPSRKRREGRHCGRKSWPRLRTAVSWRWDTFSSLAFGIVIFVKCDASEKGCFEMCGEIVMTFCVIFMSVNTRNVIHAKSWDDIVYISIKL